MKTFSFRAECPPDIEEFRKTVKALKLAIEIREVPLMLGESSAELKTDVTLEQIRDTMRRQDDSHVMIQTLRELPLEENSLERNYDVW
jgi:uncharacterized protein YajQ (UPF0234 family)